MSDKWTLNKTDIKGWFDRTKQTLMPYVIAFVIPFLLELQPIIIKKIPPEWEYAVLAVWVINRIWDLLRRYVSGK